MAKIINETKAVITYANIGVALAPKEKEGSEVEIPDEFYRKNIKFLKKKSAQGQITLEGVKVSTKKKPEKNVSSEKSETEDNSSENEETNEEEETPYNKEDITMEWLESDDRTMKELRKVVTDLGAEKASSKAKMIESIKAVIEG